MVDKKQPQALQFLTVMLVPYDVTKYQQLVNERTENLHLTALEYTGSTNRDAKLLAAAGASEGTAVAAFRQTEGRGRLGRSFFSPEGGLYLSVILRPVLAVHDIMLITAAAAAAAAESIEAISGRKTMIKWVNDIYIGGLKVCGILTEGAFSQQEDRLDHAVLGIGFNLAAPDGGYPQELSGIAGAVFEQDMPDVETAAWLTASFADRFFEYYRDVGRRSFLTEYKKRSLLDGKSVQYIKNGAAHTAVAVGIDEDARLILDEHGERVLLGAGEVSVRVCI